MKAFLGMGLLGSNFVTAMLRRNEEVQVWNRTFSKAAHLAASGAKPFENPADAVRNADIIHLTLKDDDSVNEVLDQALPALKPGAIIIDHTTTSVAGATERTWSWKKKGFIYQHAPVFMGPANALDGSGFMLVSGDQTLLENLEKELSVMTGKLINFGSEPGRAAAMKLIGNCFLVGFTVALGDALTLAKSLDAPLSDVDNLFSEWNPARSLTARINRISQDDFSQPSWELNMARKDTWLFLQAAGNHLEIIPTIASLMDRWITKGFGNHDWTVIASSERK
ncbi:MAG: NAD(P)-dependent oxidoreductase [Bacteroidetes bacterium]|nr:MAG: NAD(P)-dependent oxidoreductase [Bacteroidota bacterium]